MMEVNKMECEIRLIIGVVVTMIIGICLGYYLGFKKAIIRCKK